jgi:hypothetical protein
MNLKDFSNIIRDEIEKLAPEDRVDPNGNFNFYMNVKCLAVKTLLETPIMKAAYPNVNLYHNQGQNEFGLEYVAFKNTRFFLINQDGASTFKEKSKPTTFYESTPIISNQDKDLATKIKNLTKPNSKYKDFFDNITIEDINSISSSCEKRQVEFLNIIKAIKINDPTLRRQLTSDVIKLAEKCSTRDTKSNNTYTTNLIFDVSKDGLGDEYDIPTKLRNFLNFEGIETTNSDFDNLDEDTQGLFYAKMVKENLNKNSVSYLLVNDHKNFINNVMDKLIFEEMKRALNFKMKLVSNDMSVEQICEQYPVINKIMEEALRQDPMLYATPESQFKHLVEYDKEKFNTEIGSNYLDYIPHIVNDYEKVRAIFEDGMAGFYSKSYYIITDNFDGEVIRFTGTDGAKLNYQFSGTVTESDNPHKVLKVDNFFVNKASDEILKKGMENILELCKKNNYLLVFDYRAMEKGLKYEQSEILAKIVAQYEKEVYTFLTPSDNKKLEIIQKINLPLSEIIKEDKKINDLLYSNKSVNEIIKILNDEENKNKHKI